MERRRRRLRDRRRPRRRTWRCCTSRAARPGTPKGAVHVHEAVVAHRATGRIVLDLRPGDVFWCTADPGWVTGTSYGIIAPLTLGVTCIVDEAEFEADRWYGILQDQRVTVWYTAPTALRMLMRVGRRGRARVRPRARCGSSRASASRSTRRSWCGARRRSGCRSHDNWWQTETGGIMIANYRSMDVRPGLDGPPAARDRGGGRPARRGRQPGAGAATGRSSWSRHPGEQGELVLRPGWPSMFRGYLGEEERYRKCFAGGWYLTGDLVRRDATATSGSSAAATT